MGNCPPILKWQMKMTRRLEQQLGVRDSWSLHLHLSYYFISNFFLYLPPPITMSFFFFLSFPPLPQKGIYTYFKELKKHLPTGSKKVLKWRGRGDRRMGTRVPPLLFPLAPNGESISSVHCDLSCAWWEQGGGFSLISSGMLDEPLLLDTSSVDNTIQATLGIRPVCWD